MFHSLGLLPVMSLFGRELDLLQVTWLILSPGVGLHIQLHYWSSGIVDGWYTLVDPPLVIANCKVEFI